MSAEKHHRSKKLQRGFTLIEMMIATIVVLVGLIAVAQLVPAAAMLNSANRNDGTTRTTKGRERNSGI